MRLSPQQIGVELGRLAHVDASQALEIEALKAQVMRLEEANDELKTIVERMLMKSDPKFRTKRALESTDEFLRNRFGRARTSSQNQE